MVPILLYLIVRLPFIIFSYLGHPVYNAKIKEYSHQLKSNGQQTKVVP